MNLVNTLVVNWTKNSYFLFFIFLVFCSQLKYNDYYYEKKMIFVNTTVLIITLAEKHSKS